MGPLEPFLALESFFVKTDYFGLLRIRTRMGGVKSRRMARAICQSFLLVRASARVMASGEVRVSASAAKSESRACLVASFMLK